MTVPLTGLLYPSVETTEGQGQSILKTSNPSSPTMEGLCSDIFKSLQDVFSKINQQVDALSSNFNIPIQDSKARLSSTQSNFSPLQPRHKRRGFGVQADSSAMMLLMKKMGSIAAFVLFAYESQEMKQARLEPTKLLPKINGAAIRLRDQVPHDVKQTNLLYTVMCNIVGRAFFKRTQATEPGQAQDCVMAGSSLAKSMMIHRIRLLVIGTVTLLSTLTTYSIFFKLGLLACAVYTVFMFIMYAKQVFDIKWAVNTLNENIGLAKELMSKEAGKVRVINQ